LNSKLQVNRKSIIVYIVTIGLAVGITLGVVSSVMDEDSNISPSPSSSSPSLSSPSSSSPTVSAQEENSIVPLDQIVGGGPPRDGIPSIDNPRFVSVQEADEFIEDGEFVVGLNINGDIRAYPLQILVWHEIVNDNVGGVPVAVTYCPLCFTNQVFNRTLQDGNVVEFGTSGKLYNSNLVMYDRTSESYWSQAMAQSIVGKYAGTNLQRIPFDVANWKEWKELYPESKVLSRDTGSNRPYGADPYGDYYTNSQVLFPVSNQDDRLGLKEIIIGLENGGQFKAYKLQDIEDKKIINDQINNKPISLFSAFPFMIRAFDPVIDIQTLQFGYNPQNNTFIDTQTSSEWNFEGLAIAGPLQGKQLNRLPFDEGFWFEWVAFHPETELYTA
jgi:Protein of unknown function (DUF3179)